VMEAAVEIFSELRQAVFINGWWMWKKLLI
jgi:hypothetical protein